MQTVKSIPVRKNYYRNGQEVSVYLALVPIPCQQCGIRIEPDEMFSRTADKQGKIIGIRYSFCRKRLNGEWFSLADEDVAEFLSTEKM